MGCREPKNRQGGSPLLSLSLPLWAEHCPQLVPVSLGAGKNWEYTFPAAAALMLSTAPGVEGGLLSLRQQHWQLQGSRVLGTR